MWVNLELRADNHTIDEADTDGRKADVGYKEITSHSPSDFHSADPKVLPQPQYPLRRLAGHHDGRHRHYRRRVILLLVPTRPRRGLLGDRVA
jgi:hypothetical protein